MRKNYSNSRAASLFRSIFQNFGKLTVVLLLPLLIGWWVAQTMIPQPAIGLITLDADIWSRSAELVMMQLDEVRQNPRIKGVVIRIDSPGGAVVPSQQLYLELQNLRREMPVVASIESVAASGGYYIALAADPIYAKPSSTLGNVGVWGVIPQQKEQSDLVVASGAFKLKGSGRDEILSQVESMKQEFLATVYSQRGERMAIPRSDLAQGMAYLGRDAISYGLIDQLGSHNEAVEKAAELAGIKNYEVINLQNMVYKDTFGEEVPVFFSPWEEDPWVGAADVVTGKRDLPPGIYLLYDMQASGAKNE